MNGNDFEWGYGSDNGPSIWGQHIPQANGNMQSPVALDAANALYDPALGESPLHLEWPSTPSFIFVPQKHGFSVQVDGNSCVLKGGPVTQSGEYRMEQFHFHWSDSNDTGSEHSLNGRHYASEAHFVFWNCTLYESFQAAASKNNGLCVVSFLIEVGDDDHPIFDPLFDTIQGMVDNEDFTMTHLRQPLNLEEYFSEVNWQQYVTYTGSLTTPPCFESVQWIVLLNTLKLSEKQLNLLRATHLGCACCHGVKRNFRELCPLNERTVKISFELP